MVLRKSSALNWLLALLLLSPWVGTPGSAYGQANGDDAPLVGDSSVGYIDSAILASVVRWRYDGAYGNVKPSRAEFFWPVGGQLGPGPGAETNVDYQDFTTYLELRTHRWVSVFGELPFRLLNPELLDNTTGLTDANFGAKVALWTDCQQTLTFQFRTYVPSGDRSRGLGNGHVSLEPALLLHRRLGHDFVLEGELRDWIPLGGTEDFAGNVLRYGLGLSRSVCRCPGVLPVRAVVEAVGWTVLDGRAAVTVPPDTQIVDATGETIANIKVGLRSLVPGGDLYLGYGRGLTNETWYDDILRLEYRVVF